MTILPVFRYFLKTRSSETSPMHGSIAYERFAWFHDRIKSGRYPNSRDLDPSSPAAAFDVNSACFIQFTPFRARWIRQQTWHPDQTHRNTADGGIELSFPVADFREVKMMILQFGADVQVVSPASLRAEIADEIRKMSRIYPDKGASVDDVQEK
jgi:predicted DNA-binding transcriptional regulator YafY